MDLLYGAIVQISRLSHRGLAALQTGELRWYAMTFAIGLIGIVAIVLRALA